MGLGDGLSVPRDRALKSLRLKGRGWGGHNKAPEWVA